MRMDGRVRKNYNIIISVFIHNQFGIFFFLLALNNGTNILIVEVYISITVVKSMTVLKSFLIVQII